MSKYGPEAYEKNGSRPPASSCPDGRRYAELKAYLDGELASLRRWLLQRHLARCAACREEMSELKRLGEDMKDLDRAVPRPELRARILANLPPPALQETPSLSPLRRAVPRLALGGALAVLGAGAVFATTQILRHSAIRKDEGSRTYVTLPMPETRYARDSTPPFIPKKQGEDLALNNGSAAARRRVDPFNPDHFQDQASSRPSPKAAPSVPTQPHRDRAVPPPQRKPQEKAPVPLDLSRPVQLALVVNDTDSLYQHIQTRAEKLGGRIVSLRSDSPDETPEKVPGPKKEGASPAPPQHGNVLTLSVPIAHARALIAALKPLGTVMPAPVAPAMPAGNSALPRPGQLPFSRVWKERPQLRPEEDGSIDKSVPIRPRLAMPDKVYKLDKTDGSVTIVLKLYRRVDPSH